MYSTPKKSNLPTEEMEVEASQELKVKYNTNKIYAEALTSRKPRSEMVKPQLGKTGSMISLHDKNKVLLRTHQKRNKKSKLNAHYLKKSLKKKVGFIFTTIEIFEEIQQIFEELSVNVYFGEEI